MKGRWELARFPRLLMSADAVKCDPLWRRRLPAAEDLPFWNTSSKYEYGARSRIRTRRNGPQHWFCRWLMSPIELAPRPGVERL